MPDGSFVKCDPLDENGERLMMMDGGKSKYDYKLITSNHYYDANAGKKGKPKFKDIK